MTATNNRMFERLTSLHFGSLSLEQISIILAWTLRHLEIFALYAHLCLNKCKTGRHNTLPLWKNLNILKQTLSKKIMTRPANNGCGEGSHVSHAIIKRNFEGTTRGVTGEMPSFKMANVSNLEELLQSENWLLRKKEWYPWCTWYIY